MKLPLSWINEFVQIDDIPVVEVARLLTAAGLEIDDIRFAGLPLPDRDDHGFKVSGIAWDKEKIVVAEIRAVNPHPNADRLTLCELFDGEKLHTVLTGAPNLHPYKGQGTLPQPIKVAYAKEGATIYDGHAEGLSLTTLKRAKIRGVESYSMVCSEKELGISEEHEGVIFLDEEAQAGTPLTDYIGDAVLEISILPNHARNTSVMGIARELAALTGRQMKKPQSPLQTGGEAIGGRLHIRIGDPALNPRFMAGLIRGVTMRPSPYWVQRRLRLCGMRPISNIVDATNYTMLEIGQPLHAFDHSILQQRAAGTPITILTRTATPGETLLTLDGITRQLTETNVLVCDEHGALSLAGVMGGAESEINDHTADILLEAAAWNFINIRKTANQHNLPSEASYRFSRGVHPSLAEEGLRRCLYWMQQWSGGQIAPDTVDEYPQPPHTPTIHITSQDIRRALGIQIPLPQAKTLLEGLEFQCEIRSSEVETLVVTPPPFRMDIGEGITGIADVMEEIARLYGYDNIPETRLADPLPPQRGNPSLEAEEKIRNLLAGLGLQEVITYRMTSPEVEAKLLPSNLPTPHTEYVRLANPIAPEKRVLRRSLLASLLGIAEKNNRLRETLALFEIGAIYLPQTGDLPAEPRRLAISLSGKRYPNGWDEKPAAKLDFYDLKGILEALFGVLHLNITYAPAENPTYHPGKCAAVKMAETTLGVFGELHPLVQENYDFSAPMLAADLDLEAILHALPGGYPLQAVSEYPPIYEDIALIVEEDTPAEKVEALIRQTGGKMLEEVRLFDVFRGEQIGAGKKSLAYALVYRSPEGTLTDKDSAQIRNRIVRRLENETGAKLRS